MLDIAVLNTFFEKKNTFSSATIILVVAFEQVWTKNHNFLKLDV